MEATVSQDSGTIQVLDQPKIEEVKVVVPESKTLEQREQEWREQHDKKHGRDITKLFPTQTPKKEEPKTEVAAKVEDKPKIEEPKKEEPAKAKSGFQRVMAKKNREIGELTERSRQLEARLQALEGGKKPETTTVVEAKEPIKPIRSTFDSTDKYLDAFEKWVDDVRKYDNDRLTKQTKTELGNRDQEAQQAAATERFNSYVAKRDAIAKTIPDWDEVIEKSGDIKFKSALAGMLIDLGNNDPKIFYDMAKVPREARQLDKLTEESIASLGTDADDLSGVVRHLLANPSDIDKLNGLAGTKKAKFIGIIESKLEVPAKKEEPKTEVVAPLPAKDASPKPEPKASEQAEPARRQRPEPPPKVSGSAPPPSDWKEPQEMTLEERERLWREDPRHKRGR